MDTLPTTTADREFARTHWRDAVRRAHYWLGPRKGRGPRPEMARRCYVEMAQLVAMFHGAAI